MPDTISGMVAEIRSIVDVPEADALSALNRRHRTMVSRARSLRKLVEMGPTVAGQGWYNTPPGVVEILPGGLRVGGVPYGKARRDDVHAASLGSLAWSGPGGLVVSDTDADGNQGLSFIPAPTETDLPIELYAAMVPADVTLGQDAAVLSVDPDMYDVLIDAAAATWLRRQGEGNPDADEQRFAAACEELRARVSNRLSRTGPAQIRIIGTNA